MNSPQTTSLDHQADPRPPEGAEALSRRVDDLLRDVQGGCVARLKELTARLEEEGARWDDDLLARAVGLLRAQSLTLDFSALDRRGLLARISGRSRSTRQQFASQVREVVAAAEAVRRHYEDLLANHRTHGTGARRLLVLLDAERKELERHVERCVQWLAEMTADIARRQAVRTGDGAGLVLLKQRAEFFTGHVRRLHALAEEVRRTCQPAQNVLGRRGSLLEQLQVDLETFEAVWLRHLRPLCAAGLPTPEMRHKAVDAHDELLQRLERSHGECTRLREEELAAAKHLQALRRALDSLTG